MDPLKLHVGNLEQNVNEDELLNMLTPIANVTKVFISKKTSQDPKYGFVYLSTEEDVRKIMDLNTQDYHSVSSKLEFRPALRRYMSPGEEYYVRLPLPDRDYDLSPFDSDKSYIHKLNDDVMIKIFEYLPLKTRICCEIVCRRWQALLYIMFESTTQLNLDTIFVVKNSLSAVTKDTLAKLLLLTGNKLKSLSLAVVNGLYYTAHSEKHTNVNLFLIVSQLCKNLECLELSNYPISYFDDVKALYDCKTLKCFYAKKCFILDDCLFKNLLSVLPCLEKINICYSKIKGNCFNILPEGLKELNINFCKRVSKKSLHKINMVCKNLEVLEMLKLEADKEFLEQLGANCKNMRSLVFQSFTAEVSSQIKVFTKLNHLKIVASTFELSNIDNLKDLEELCIKVKQKSSNMVDFGKFKCLKKVGIFSSPFNRHELMSLGKCKNLQYVKIMDCGDIDQDFIKMIVRCCPEIKAIKCPNVWLNDYNQFLNEIVEIMSNRSEPLKLVVNQSDLSYDEMDVAADLSEKIEIEFDDFDEENEDDYEDYDHDFGESGYLIYHAEDFSDPYKRLDEIIRQEEAFVQFGRQIAGIGL